MAINHLKPQAVLLSVILIFGMGAMASVAEARSVFLNGTDISSARSQELKNVNIVINEKGDVFVIAPHYQVHEEDSYIPLSTYVQGLNSPKHVTAGTIPGHPGLKSADGDVKTASDGQVVKAGEKEALPPETPMFEKSTEDKNE